jgi:hypothetical protein
MVIFMDIIETAAISKKRKSYVGRKTIALSIVFLGIKWGKWR